MFCTAFHGRDLSESSCKNAWQKIPDSTQSQFFRPRKYLAGLLTPIRYLSDDGACAIDIVLETGARGDISNWYSMSKYAKDILDKCVTRQQIGGSIRKFSE